MREWTISDNDYSAVDVGSKNEANSKRTLGDCV